MIPDSLGRALAPSLQLLDLSDNYLTGTLPSSIFSMPLLHTLYLMGRGEVDAGNGLMLHRSLDLVKVVCWVGEAAPSLLRFI